MDGRSHALCEFGWNSSQTPAVQRAKFQCALDSGENLVLPVCEPVDTDEPLIMRRGGSLKGGGADIMQSGFARSMIRSGDPQADILQVLGSHARISDIAFHRDGQNAEGSGLVIGDGVNYTRAVIVEGVSTNAGLKRGIYVKGAGGCVFRDSWLWGRHSALEIDNQIEADAGDNKITNVDFNADPQVGAGLRYVSGGGLYIVGSKFNIGYNHIRFDWDRGGSANFLMTTSSLETCTAISVDMFGTKEFQRVGLVANTWATNSVILAVRNNPLSGGLPRPTWLNYLHASDNTMSGGSDGNALFDIACTQSGFITNNQFIGNNRASCGVLRRAPIGDVKVRGNKLFGCPVEVAG